MAWCVPVSLPQKIGIEALLIGWLIIFSGDRPAFDNVHGRVFPVVAMNSVGARIRVNFGGPFGESSQTF